MVEQFNHGRQSPEQIADQIAKDWHIANGHLPALNQWWRAGENGVPEVAPDPPYELFQGINFDEPVHTTSISDAMLEIELSVKGHVTPQQMGELFSGRIGQMAIGQLQPGHEIQSYDPREHEVATTEMYERALPDSYFADNYQSQTPTAQYTAQPYTAPTEQMGVQQSPETGTELEKNRGKSADNNIYVARASKIGVTIMVILGVGVVGYIGWNASEGADDAVIACAKQGVASLTVDAECRNEIFVQNLMDPFNQSNEVASTPEKQNG